MPLTLRRKLCIHGVVQDWCAHCTSRRRDFDERYFIPLIEKETGKKIFLRGMRHVVKYDRDRDRAREQQIASAVRKLSKAKLQTVEAENKTSKHYLSKKKAEGTER